MRRQTHGLMATVSLALLLGWGPGTGDGGPSSVLGLQSSAAAAQEGRFLGGGLSADPAGWAFHPTLATAADGTLYAAWSQHTNPATWQLVGTYVARWTTGAWQPLGGRVGTPADPDGGIWAEGYAPALAVVGSTPYVAWYEGGGYGWGTVAGTAIRTSVFVAHWDGSQWVTDRNPAMPNGALNTAPGNAGRTPALAVVSGVLHAAWIETHRPPAGGAVNVLVVQRLAGGQWSPVGPPIFAGPSPGTILDLALAEAGGSLYAGWAQDGRLYVARWDGTTWAPVGAALQGAPGGRANQVALTGLAGVPYVAWQERPRTGPSQVYVQGWTGTAWVPLGGSLNVDPGRGEAGRPALASDGTNLWLAWTEGGPGARAGLYLRSFRTPTWSPPTGPLNAAPGTGAADTPALTGRNGQLVVSWAEKNPPPATKQVYVKELP